MRNAQALEGVIKTGQGDPDPLLHTLEARLDALFTASSPWLAAHDLATLGLFAILTPAIASAYGSDIAEAIAHAMRMLDFAQAQVLLELVSRQTPLE
jgi:hypothetical protein